MNPKNMNIVKRIAIVAQDQKKNELIEWSFHNREILSRHQIIADGYVADILEGTLNIPVNKLLAGNLGGYHQLGKIIAEGKVDAIIFLLETETFEPNDSDIKTLLSMATEREMVIGLNMQTAEVILHSSFLNESTFTNVLPASFEKKEVV